MAPPSSADSAGCCSVGLSLPLGLGFGGLRFKVWGLGFKVQGLGFKAQGSGFRVQGFRV